MGVVVQEARLIKPKFHYADFATLSPTFSVYCNGLNSIIERHKRVCRRLVTDFVANISTCRDGLCPRLSSRGSFGESRRNGIRALYCSLTVAYCVMCSRYLSISAWSRFICDAGPLCGPPPPPYLWLFWLKISTPVTRIYLYRTCRQTMQRCEQNALCGL